MGIILSKQKASTQHANRTCRQMPHQESKFIVCQLKIARGSNRALTRYAKPTNNKQHNIITLGLSGTWRRPQRQFRCLPSQKRDHHHHHPNLPFLFNPLHSELNPNFMCYKLRGRNKLLDLLQDLRPGGANLNTLPHTTQPATTLNPTNRLIGTIKSGRTRCNKLS